MHLENVLICLCAKWYIETLLENMMMMIYGLYTDILTKIVYCTKKKEKLWKESYAHIVSTCFTQHCIMYSFNSLKVTLYYIDIPHFIITLLKIHFFLSINKSTLNIVNEKTLHCNRYSSNPPNIYQYMLQTFIISQPIQNQLQKAIPCNNRHINVWWK